MALHAVKETDEYDELDVDLTQQCGKSPVAMSAVLHRIYLTWIPPRRRIAVIYLGSRLVDPLSPGTAGEWLV